MKLIKTFTTPTDLYLLGNVFTENLQPIFSLTDDEQTLDVLYDNKLTYINTYGHVYLLSAEEYNIQEKLADELEEEIDEFCLFKKQFKGSLYVKLLNSDDFYDVEKHKRINYILESEDCFKDDIDLEDYLMYQAKDEVYDEDDYFPSLVILILKEDES